MTDEAKPPPTSPPPVTAAPTSVNSSLDYFCKELNSYYQHRGILAESYTIIKECLDKLFDTYTDDVAMGWIKAQIGEETQSIETVLKKSPIILVSGQVNCGKSSFINELLHRNIVPVEEHPCTSRIVRIRYSEEEYYQVIGTGGGVKSDRRQLKTSDLRKEVKLKDEERARRSLVEDIVEVGLNHPILAAGLQIVDTPGLSENQAMDTVVQECLDGILQVMFYVIDGNTSVRVQDLEFISYITSHAPDIKIIYICNKCEEDNTAGIMDAASDVTSESEDEAMTSIPKGQLAFRKLKTYGLLGENDDMTCDVYYQFSCKMLKRARKRAKGEASLYAREFQRLLDSVACHMRDSLRYHLLQAIVTACGIAARVFDFLVSERCVKHHVLHHKLRETKRIERKLNAKCVQFIAKQRTLIDTSIQEKVEKNVDNIVSCALDLDLGIVENDAAEDFQRYRQIIADFIVRFLLDRIVYNSKVNGILRTIETEIRENIAELFNTCEKLDGDGDMLSQIKCCYTIDLAAAMHVHNLSEKVMKKSLFVRLWEIFEDVTCLADVTERQWKEETCRNLLESIDSSELGRIICDQLCGELTNAHKHFKKILKMVAAFIETLHVKVKSYEPYIAPLSKHICILTSLDSSVRHGKVELLQLVGNGHRCQVYKCRRVKTKAVARLVHGDERFFSEFAEMLNFQRNLPHYHEHLLKAFDISRDNLGRVVALVPHAGTSLFHELCQDMTSSYTLSARLEIARQIVTVCKFVREKGFSLVDLRPNNIMLKNGHAKIDLCKPRGLTIPYPPPDDKPPFHFAPEIVGNNRSRNVNDSYSCTIVVWFLTCGKFIRPPFANTAILDDINKVVSDDVTRVQQELVDTLESVRRTCIWKLDGSPRLIRNVIAILKLFIVAEDDRKPIDILYERFLNIIKE